MRRPSTTERLDRMELRRCCSPPEPRDRVTGRVTYNQQFLKEFGLLPEARGRGADAPGSYSLM